MVWAIALWHLQFLFQARRKVHAFKSSSVFFSRWWQSLLWNVTYPYKLAALTLSQTHNIKSSSEWCLSGTQITTTQNLACLDSNTLFSDVGPCFFSTGMIRFIAILVLIPFPQIPWFNVRQLIYYKAQCEYLFSPPSLTHTPFPCVLVEKFCSMQVPSSSTPTSFNPLCPDTFTLSAEAYSVYSPSNPSWSSQCYFGMCAWLTVILFIVVEIHCYKQKMQNSSSGWSA